MTVVVAVSFRIVGLLLITSMLIIALFWGIIAKYQIGGQTGDVCGAGQLLSETMGWVMLASIYAV